MKKSCWSSLLLRTGVLAVIPLVGVVTLGDDAPNARLEKRLDNTYQKYNKKKTDLQLWEYARTQAGIKTYKAQKGDTLSEISEVIFGDPSFWPKIWSLNKNILNPHEISPGAVLTFTAGTSNDAPGVDVVESSKAPEAIPEVLALTANVQLPEPQHLSKTPVLELPGSLPNWKYRKEPTISIKTDFSRRVGFAGDAVKSLPYYTTPQAIEGVGEVVGTEGGMKSAAEFQYIYVRLNKALTDKTFIAVSNVYSLEEKEGIRPAGQVVRVDGQIEIGDLVNPDEKIYRAMVRKNIHPIEVGDRLVATSLPTMTIRTPGEPAQVKATVAWGVLDEGTLLFGTESMLVIDRGSKAGLAVGQTLALFQKTELRNETDLEKARYRQIALAEVVHVSDSYATAMVVDQKEPVQVGDLTMSTGGGSSTSYFPNSGTGTAEPGVDPLTGKADDFSLDDIPKAKESTPAKSDSDPLLLPDEKPSAPRTNPDDDLKLD